MNTPKNRNSSELSNLVIGLGEVGSALQKVLNCHGHDPAKGVIARGHYETIHICFPYNQSLYDFKTEVENYKREFTPHLVVIHSTVPLGTSRALQAVHSPVRGVHPNLSLGIRTFVKFFGGSRAKEAAEIFRKKGIKVECTAKQEETEAGKLWDTTQYGVFILLNKEIHDYCAKYELDFNTVYSRFNETYNQGYTELGRHEVVRPFLSHVDGPIGGHCVVPNAHLFDSVSAKWVINENDRLRKHEQKSSRYSARRVSLN